MTFPVVRDAMARGAALEVVPWMDLESLVERLASAHVLLGIFGTALFFGDSMITPAISVLSAVEGLKIVDPGLEELVVPITAVIIVALMSTSIPRASSAVPWKASGELGSTST